MEVPMATNSVSRPTGWRAGAIRDTGDIVGYSIEAIDGEVGKVAKANNATASRCLVVSTGPWIFGKRVVLPADAIDYLDHEGRVVQLALRKGEVRSAPEYHRAG
jgi:hypothetical protein